MAVSTSTLLYPNTAADSAVSGGSTWTNPNNAKVLDGVYATTNIGPGAGFKSPASSDFLYVSNFLFNLPPVAIIDGIYVEAIYTATGGIPIDNVVAQLYKAGTAPYNYPNTRSNTNSSSATATFGGATDLWNIPISAADVNNSGFGVGIQGQNYNSGSGNTFNIDAIRMTVYWHLPPAQVPTTHMYKVYNRNWKFLGLIPNVKNEFTYNLDINTAGSQISIESATSIDTSVQLVDNYTDESGNVYTDELGLYNYTTEAVAPIAAVGSSGFDALIKNGNHVIVQEVSYYYPNGITVFRGEIDRWEAKVGASGDDFIKVTAYSDGQDLDNMIARGAPFAYTADQSQTAQNATDTMQTGQYNQGNSYAWDGQSFTTGVGVTNIGRIQLLLNGTATVTVSLYSSPNAATALGSVTVNVAANGAQVVSFAFPNPVAVTASTQYFIGVSVAQGQSIVIYYQNSDVYSGGARYTRVWSGGNAAYWQQQPSHDLYFTTASGTGSTTGTYTNQDPSTGMIVPIMQDYNLRGGAITTTSSSVDATGLSLSYTFSVQTIYEAIKAGLSMSPSGFYYYVDVGSNILYMKRSSSTADILIVKGQHIEEITISATIEDVKNDMLFTGGVVSGSNLYKEYSDQTSISSYGVRLDRTTDNRVTVTGTADAIGGTFITTKKDEKFATTVTLLAGTMDLMTIKPGKVLGFRGFGNFVDQLLMQIVRIEYHAEHVVCTLGIIPKKTIPAFEKVTRGLVAAQTVANPTAPS